MIRKLAVFGVGLIGGSFALALREGGQVREIVGFGRSAENLSAALGMYLIDAIAPTPADAVRDADFVFIAVPVAQFQPTLAAIAPYLGPQTLLTDAGSTKGDVVAAARATLGAALPRFVPGHPVAGTENSGAKAARGDLYRGRNVILTPLPETDAAAVETVRALWQGCGAKVTDMTPESHDAMLAAVSHLPHILAFALVHMLAGRPDAAALFSQTGGGFRDTTRIAASSPEMWRDICLANRDALLAEIDGYAGELSNLRALIAERDGEGLAVVFEKARKARRSLPD